MRTTDRLPVPCYLECGASGTKMARRLATVIALLGWVSETGAMTYTVTPDGTGDFPTIQAAINASTDGDVIELADGVFTGDGNAGVSFVGKTITVRSASLEPALCIIDGEGTRPGFIFLDGESRDARLERVTIRNSSRNGVALDSSAPTIIGCRIISNGHWGIDAGFGAAPWIEDCVISGNLLHGLIGNLVSNVTLVGCTITGNRAGGVFTDDTVTAERTVFWGNCGPDITVDSFAGARARGTASLTCCLVDTTNVATPFGNIHYVADNVFTNPLFCYPADCNLAPTTAGEYTVDVLSPCLPSNSPCGQLIGALGANCSGSTPTVVISWGEVKGRFQR